MITGSFRAALLNARSQPEATNALRDAVAPLGFCDFNYGSFNYPASLTTSFPDFWGTPYRAASWFRSDRLVREARKRLAPFLVHDVLMGPPVTATDAAIETIIRQEYQGLVVPIHCPEAGFAAAALYSRMERGAFVSMIENVRGPVSMMVLEYHEAVRRFFVGGPTADGRKSLSKREREILGWAARGKTSAEIAEIAGLAHATVNNHMAKILRKLKVRSRSEAVAVALTNSQIARIS